MIEAIIFNFGQTLVDSASGFRLAEKEAQARLANTLGAMAKKNYIDVYRRIRGQFQAQSNFSRISIWQEVCRYYDFSPEASLLEIWEEEYWQTVRSHSKLFPETQQTLEALNLRYKLALITNTQGQRGAANHRIDRFPQLEKYFASIIVAGQGGIPPKPDPKPFQLCLEALGLKPWQAVYVGDDYRIDICGARDSGLQPIWLKHHSVKRNWPQTKTATPVITGLGELLEIERLLG
jgi:HAD superfamily hydrolase (TIGR01549 family)